MSKELPTVDLSDAHEHSTCKDPDCQKPHLCTAEELLAEIQDLITKISKVPEGEQ